MINKNHLYIRRAIQLAQKAIGKTYPNPMVGCVIVHKNRIIGEGFHHKAGEPHAEINAINSVKKEDQHLLKEATIYVSLEPCAHYGKTPPCAIKISEIDFKKVVIGCSDSNNKVNGKGVQILKSKGNIEITENILKEECRNINKRFFTYHEKKRPFIILKWAESADGFLDKDFKATAISNLLASQYVHKMRAEENAILIGTRTALIDNPTLTVRYIKGKNPIRVLIDNKLQVPHNANIFNSEAKTLVFNTIKNETYNNIEYIKIKKQNLIEDILTELYKKEIQSIIIEGGSYTLQQFINKDIWDEVLIIKNSSLFLKNGTKAPKINSKPNYVNDMRDNKLLHFINKKSEYL